MALQAIEIHRRQLDRRDLPRAQPRGERSSPARTRGPRDGGARTGRRRRARARRRRAARRLRPRRPIRKRGLDLRRERDVANERRCWSGCASRAGRAASSSAAGSDTPATCCAAASVSAVKPPAWRRRGPAGAWRRAPSMAGAANPAAMVAGICLRNARRRLEGEVAMRDILRHRTRERKPCQTIGRGGTAEADENSRSEATSHRPMVRGELPAEFCGGGVPLASEEPRGVMHVNAQCPSAILESIDPVSRDASSRRQASAEADRGGYCVRFLRLWRSGIGFPAPARQKLVPPQVHLAVHQRRRRVEAVVERVDAEHLERRCRASGRRSCRRGR